MANRDVAGRAAQGPQQAVERARAQVLAGRGPGAEQAETDRHKRERPTLGPLPAPLVRELVHLNTARFRAGSADDLDETAVQNQRDRLVEMWGPTPSRRPDQSPPAHRRRAGIAGFIAGATVAVAVSRRLRGAR